eukprot:CAMPEP_0198249974 /NCGR_PEP_ID=MMETSP1447-20131203/1321_1 /TAXON_ID=420782 /ORGANISM="Chaetoceros dichaeta, Strain CCMP1751" /LENGTH=174 /DNA_ID=CAMNT_0043934727 /DNA_START=308 /DNA_END=829 /DNA_ORIENTATION=-
MEGLLTSTGLQRSQTTPQQDNDSQLDVCAMFPSLSFQERLGGCIGCMILGYALSFGSFFRFKSLLHGNSPIPFILFATMGNVISLCGSCFLSGPQTQINKMWHPSRRYATGLYVGSLVVTVVVMLLFEFVFVGGNTEAGDDNDDGVNDGGRRRLIFQALLLVLLLMCQYVAVAW